MSDTIFEGESFIITENTLPNEFEPWQNLYDAVTGTRFGVEQGALTENITVGFNFMSLDCNNPGFYFDPSCIRKDRTDRTIKQDFIVFGGMVKIILVKMFPVVSTCIEFKQVNFLM